MSISTSSPDQLAGLELESEFEHEPVPSNHRKSLRSVAAVWFGFPMILTCSVFGGLLAAFLGFKGALAAIVVGNLVLMFYVGALSYLAGRTGENFGLQASRVFGRIGSLAVAGFLATVVVGWFAFQTGLTGATVQQSFGWDEKAVTLAAGVLFTAVTFIGIRALSVLGMIAVPFFLVAAGVSLYIIATGSGLSGVWSYPGVGAGGAFSFGAGVTLVVATFADSGTMTADFTRWSRNGSQAVLATLTAFPLANAVAFTVGAIIVSSGAIADPAVNGGNFLPLLSSGHGWLLTVVAFLFVVVNLGSVCTHCLYNGAVGWSQMTRSRMRVMTLILGGLGTLVALAGIWTHFLTWLNLLGVFVPPIGAVIIADQILRRHSRVADAPRALRPSAALGYALGALAAGIIHYQAPQLSEVIFGMVFGGLGYVFAEKALGNASRTTDDPLRAATATAADQQTH